MKTPYHTEGTPFLIVVTTTPLSSTSGGTTISAQGYPAEEDAERHALAQLSAHSNYEVTVYKAIKVYRRKPIPVEVETLADCDDLR